MPRKNQNAIRNFFVIDETKNTSTCLIPNCSKKTLGTTHAVNLETHVKRHQSQVHIGFEAEKLTRNRKRKEKEDARGEVKIIRLEMSENFVKRACVELVTVNGRPFNMMQDSGFVKIVKPITDALGGGFTINPENTRDQVKLDAIQIRNKIKNEVLGKMISVKVDCATRLNRSVYAVNFQFIRYSSLNVLSLCYQYSIVYNYRDGKIKLRTMAMRELFDRHTGIDLKNILLQVLADYGVSISQIYSVTTDNGADMLNAVKRLVQDSSSQLTARNALQDDEDVDELSDNEFGGNITLVFSVINIIIWFIGRKRDRDER